MNTSLAVRARRRASACDISRDSAIVTSLDDYSLRVHSYAPKLLPFGRVIFS
jgi:hypothetical protein